MGGKGDRTGYERKNDAAAEAVFAGSSAGGSDGAVQHPGGDQHQQCQRKRRDHRE